MGYTCGICSIHNDIWEINQLMFCNIPSYRTHYKEYLVDKINKKKLDPVTIYETPKVELILTREEMAVPERNNENDLEEEVVEETDEEYRERLIKVRKSRYGQRCVTNKRQRTLQLMWPLN